VLQLPSQSVALLAVLFNRGPQTAGELRIASDRLHKFTDISAVEAFLDELRERAAGALVRELARAPGARETRWAHLLSGEPAAPAHVEAPGASTGESLSVSEIATLKSNLDHLQAEVAALKETVARIAKELGL
jgi:uncharacterized protein